MIQKTVGHFKDQDGKWQECKVERGRRTGVFTYQWERDSNTAFSLYGKSPTYMAWNHIVECKGLQFNTRRRAAKNLGQTVELKLTFTDVNGGSSSFTYAHTNDPLPLRTKAEALTEENDNEKMWSWLQCDDVEAEGRLTVEGWSERCNHDSKRRMLKITPLGLNSVRVCQRQCGCDIAGNSVVASLIFSLVVHFCRPATRFASTT